VDADVAIHVYRILQEAVTNVIRHSGATAIGVVLRFNPDSLLLVVEDLGRGFSGSASGHGLGIITMRERAEVMGATLEFVQPAEGGTLVRLTVPLASRQAVARVE
jgi:signal transduction histidine kinase